MKHRLMQTWYTHCVSVKHPDCSHEDSAEGLNERINCDKDERVVDAEKFDYSQVKRPGVHLDYTHYREEGKVDESYTIIIPYDYMSPELCGKYLNKLNNKYSRRMILALNPLQLLSLYEGGGSEGSINAVFLEDDVDYVRVLSKLREKDAELPAHTVLCLPTEESQEYLDEFTELYSEKEVQVVLQE